MPGLLAAGHAVQAGSRDTIVRSSVFLGLAVDSVSFKARLSVGWEGSFRASLTLFQLGRTVYFSLCLQLLGLVPCYPRGSGWVTSTGETSSFG